MKVKRVFIATAALALLGACHSNNSTEYTSYHLEKEYAGHPVNEFFNNYGFPEARFEKVDGSTVYWWSSLEYKKARPEVHPVTYYSEKGNYQIVDSSSISLQRQYCRVRIYTDQAELITRIELVVDTIGKWSNSRCSELFE